MKTFSSLLLVALLITVFAWFSLQGESRATAPAKVVITEYPLRATSAAPVSTPPPVTAKVVAVKPVSAKQLELQHALESGDLCGTARIISNGISPAETAGAYIAAIAPSAEVLDLFGPDGASVVTEAPTRKFRTAAGRAAWATRVAGLSYGVTPFRKSEDLARGRDLLLELEKQEPGNAFYPFQRLAVEASLGYKPEQLKTTAEAAANGSTFDTHFPEVFEEIWEAAWANPALLYALNYSVGPSPFDYYRSTSAIATLERDGK
jgi:hypothetical protein